MKTIAVTALRDRLKAEPSLTLIDVRTSPEFAAFHVPQARNVPLDTLEPKAIVEADVLRIDQPIYLLCHSGRRAILAAEKFEKAGFAQAIVVEGGSDAWAQAGLPVTRGRGAISIERQVRIAAGSLILLGLVLARFVHPYLIGLSAFVGAGLVFAGITDFCGMGLLLAKAPWNQRPIP